MGNDINPNQMMTPAGHRTDEVSSDEVLLRGLLSSGCKKEESGELNYIAS